jgi:hypothetical protein
MSHHRHTPWIFWPFVALWKLVAWIVNLTGRIVAIAIGATLMLLGGLISLTIIGAIIGIPLAILGLLIVLRGLF